MLEINSGNICNSQIPISITKIKPIKNFQWNFSDIPETQATMDKTPDKINSAGPSNTGGWRTQASSTKRPRPSANKPNKVKKHDGLQFSKNRFQPFSSDEYNDEDMESTSSHESNNASNNKTKKIRVPPIILDLQPADLTSSLNHFKTITNDLEVRYKNKQTHLQTHSMESYTKIIANLKHNNYKFHTFTLQDDKTIKYVIKGLHEYMKVNEIMIDENITQLNASKVTQMLSNKNKHPLPMFIVEFPAKTDPAKIKAIKSVCQVIIKWEVYRKPRGPTQCKRCQLLGHAHSNCNRSARCVKCSGPHLSSECPHKERMDTPKCANCEGNHPANYKGCEFYKKHITNIKQQRNNNKARAGDRRGPNLRASTQQAPRAAALPARDTPAHNAAFPAVSRNAADLATPPVWRTARPAAAASSRDAARSQGVGSVQQKHPSTHQGDGMSDNLPSTQNSPSQFNDILILFFQAKEFILSLLQTDIFTHIKNALQAISNADNTTEKLLIVTELVSKLFN